MAHRISVRRVMFQDINPDGTPDGPPTYGIIASDDYEKTFNNSFNTLSELNDSIEKSGSILTAIGNLETFDDADPSKIGTENYYGKFPYKTVAFNRDPLNID